MMAITVWQPWASLIIEGFKPYEFRCWDAPKSLHNTRIAIHAAARPTRRDEIVDLIVRLKTGGAHSPCLHPAALEWLERASVAPGRLFLSSVLGTAVLGQPLRASQIVHEFGVVANDSDRDEHFNWAWPMREIERFSEPVPARGAQGFWKWEPSR